MPSHRPAPLLLKLYALDVVLSDLGSPTKAKLEKAIDGHELGKAELMGTYEKRR